MWVDPSWGWHWHCQFWGWEGHAGWWQSEQDRDRNEEWHGMMKATVNGKGKWRGKRKPAEEGKWKGKGNGNEKGKGIVEQTTEGDDISCAVALQLQKEMYEAESDMEGSLGQVYLVLEVLPTVSMYSGNDTDSPKELDGEYDSEHDSDVDMRMDDDVDELYSNDLDCNMDTDRAVMMKWRTMKRRKMRRRRRSRIMMRRRVRMRIMAKNIRRLAWERW